MSGDKLVVIGRVAKPHGILGEVSVESFAESDELYAPGTVLTLQAGQGGATFAPSGQAEATSGQSARGGRGEASEQAGRSASGGRSRSAAPSGHPAGAAPRRLAVAASRPHQGRMLVTFQGVADRDAAEALRGLEVLIEAQSLPEPGEDQVYLHEIEGFAVTLADNTPVGTLESFMDLPGQDVWLIRAPDGREILLPANEQTVPEIDMEARRIVIDPPPGLLELS